MRPKKKILLVDPDENRRSIWRYVLHIWGYKVRAVATAAGAERSVRCFDIDLVIFHLSMPAPWLRKLVREIEWQQPQARTLLLCPNVRELPVGTWVTLSLLGAAARNVLEVRDQIAMLSRRKRGPRKVAVGLPFSAKKPPARVSAADILTIRRAG